MTEYLYDVAISFHSKDEVFANQLNDLLQDRFKTFLYSKKQEVLAGTDGEMSFNKAFEKEARVVVIFFRSEWGATSFTRIEETAIRNRAFSEGYDFTIFVPTETPAKTPPWLPKPRLYFGLPTFGMSGLAATIAYRVQELGGNSKPESLADAAARASRDIQLKRAKELFHRDQGPQVARKAFSTVIEALEKGIPDIQKGTGFRFKPPQRNRDNWMLFDGRYSLVVAWYQPFINDTEEASLRVRMYLGHPEGWPGVIIWDKPQQLAHLDFNLQLISMKRYGYVRRSDKTHDLDENELAEFILKSFVETIARHT